MKVNKETKEGILDKFKQDNSGKFAKWNPVCKRFVAFLDIMGFKDFVARNSHEKIAVEMLKVDNHIKEISKSNGLISSDSIIVTTFSDSIIIFSKDESIPSYIDFCSVVGKLFCKIIGDSLPVKGGIAYGDITVNQSRQIYFGQPIIDAYLLEEEVNYYGIAVHNSVEEYRRKFSTDEIPLVTILDKLVEFKTPLKSGNIEHYNLCWFDYALNEVYKDGREKKIAVAKRILNGIVNRYKISVSGNPRRYIDNTKDVIDLYIKELPRLEKYRKQHNLN